MSFYNDSNMGGGGGHPRRRSNSASTTTSAPQSRRSAESHYTVGATNTAAITDPAAALSGDVALGIRRNSGTTGVYQHAFWQHRELYGIQPDLGISNGTVTSPRTSSCGRAVIERRKLTDSDPGELNGGVSTCITPPVARQRTS